MSAHEETASIFIFSLILSLFFTARHFCSADRFFVAVTRCGVGRRDPSISARCRAHLTVPSESAGSKPLTAFQKSNTFTRVVVQLRVQVLLLAVELGVDAVNGSDQGKGPDACSDEEAHFGITFVQGVV